MDGGTWSAIVHGLAKSQTQLSNFNFTSLLKKINFIFITVLDLQKSCKDNIEISHMSHTQFPLLLSRYACYN